jgi:hypothetical protein
MSDKGPDKIVPFTVILRGTVPADPSVLVVKAAAPVFDIPQIRHIHRHEPDLEKGFTVIVKPNIAHLIDYLKVVNRFPLLVLDIHISRTPFIHTVANTCTKEVMGTYVIGLFQGAKFFYQRDTPGRMSIVTFIIAYIIPTMSQFPFPFGGVYPNLYRFVHFLYPHTCSITSKDTLLTGMSKESLSLPSSGTRVRTGSISSSSDLFLIASYCPPAG